MDQLKIPEKEVQNYFTEERLVNEVEVQFKKDFNSFEFIERVEFKSRKQLGFKRELGQVLTVCVNKSPEPFLQSLYALDLPERIIQQYYSGGSLAWDDLVDFIYRRLVLKVFLRKKLSTK